MKEAQENILKQPLGVNRERTQGVREKKKHVC